MITFLRRRPRALIAPAALGAAALSLALVVPTASALASASPHGNSSSASAHGNSAAASAHGGSGTAGGTQSAASAHGKPGSDPAATDPAASGNGDNGDVKIHNSTTAVTDERNEPHVCVFYLDAFNFDSAQSVSWQIKSWPPTGNRSVVLSGTLVLDSAGDGHTGDMSLQNGHYKLFWNFAGENGFAKQKVFWVTCPATTPPPKPKGTPPPVPGAPTATPVTGTLPVTG